MSKPAAKTPVKEKPEGIARREAKRQQTLAQRCAPADPAQVLTHREFCWLKGFNSWSAATVPIHVLLMRERYADGHKDEWGLMKCLMTTRAYSDVQQPRGDYQHRVERGAAPTAQMFPRLERFLLAGL